MTTISASVPVGEIDVGATLRPLGFLRGDPTVRRRPGRFTRATVTPDGVGVIAVRWPGPEPGLVQVATEGAGAEWLLARATGLLGGLDEQLNISPGLPPERVELAVLAAVGLECIADCAEDLALDLAAVALDTEAFGALV